KKGVPELPDPGTFLTSYSGYTTSESFTIHPFPGFFKKNPDFSANFSAGPGKAGRKDVIPP
ncbi:MAG: hypothetical protein IKP09_08060, partial [Lentisphaeria bacterium]|nr:hypothetical protein [Lentisphaeria bacterium]